MAISTIIKQECPVCHKQAVEHSKFTIGTSVMTKLACGHILTYTSSVSKKESDYDSLVFSDGAKPRAYQIEAIKFAEAANFNCIIADEQGLGKTIEVLCCLRLHPEKLLPAVICVPTTVKLQWMHEITRICNPNNTPEGKLQYLTQVIQSGKEKALPGFQIYIVTFDMLKKEDMFEYVNGDIKTIIIDECQRIKNHLSDRAKAVQRIVKITEHCIPMSGTPIKNNAGEYYTVLNAVAPARFPQYKRYLDDYCDFYENGYGYKIGGLRNPQLFHEDTKDIIIRRTKEQVLKDLPELERKFYHVDLDPKLNKAYAKALEELDELFYSDEGTAFERSSATIEVMTRLRHIVGQSKTGECLDYVTEFLESSDRKITIFVHHNDVGDTLEITLNKYLAENNMDKVLRLHSGLNGDERARLVQRFKDSSARVMIASTLAAGEGLNLQFSSDAILLERQWNPANEEQAEARFHRFGQKNNVSVTYMIASGTIDEYFTELVEQKRAIVASTMDNKEIQWNQQSLMAELAQILVTKGREKFKL